MPQRRLIDPPNPLFERVAPSLPWLVLVVGLTMTSIAYWLIYSSVRDAEQMRFNSYSSKLTDQVSARLKSYERLLAAAGGFVIASDEVTPQEWRTFVNLQGLPDFPGAAGLALIVPVHDNDVASFSQSMRQHFPDFTISHRGNAELHYIIKYIEPLESNRPAHGLDATHDPVRTEALNRACDSGQSTMTRRIALTQALNPSPGAVYLFPIYAKGVIPTSVELRRKQLVGWIGIPLSINDVMQGLTVELGNQIDFELYHGDSVSPDSLLYDADGDSPIAPNFQSPDFQKRQFITTRAITIGGQKWTLVISSRPAFLAHSSSQFPWYVAVPGVLVSGLLALLVHVMRVSRHRARMLAADTSYDLRASEERYRLLVENVHDAAGIILDPLGNITSWNLGAARLFGHAEKDAIGQPLALFFSAEDVAANEPETRLDQARNQPASQFEGWRFRKDGSRFWGYTSLTPLRETDGSLRGYAMLTRDMTERKKNEEARALAAQLLEVQNAELAKARDIALASVQAKTEFLANMSHEIRTPMTSILGYADVLMDEAAQLPAPEHYLDAITSIRRNGSHLLAIINDILDVSRIDAGQVSLQSIRVSPVSALEEIVSLMNVRAVSKGLALLTDIHFPLPASIHTDPIRLRQVLVNLVGNAIKFTSVGSVTLRLSFSQENSALLFQVTDTGIGIAPADQERIFAPFAQVESSASRRFGGTGLGLHISRRLAHILGGSISVQSELAKGSTFSLYLSLRITPDKITLIHDSPPPSTDPSSSSIASGERLHGNILLAEDGIDNQRLFAFLLRRAGANVSLASNGKEALDAVRALLNGGPKFDLILMDMQMPELDGYAATRAIRALGVQIPIIALTAHAMTGDREACLHAGCNDYMPKPIDHASLIALCNKYLTSNSSASPA